MFVRIRTFANTIRRMAPKRKFLLHITCIVTYIYAHFSTFEFPINVYKHPYSKYQHREIVLPNKATKFYGKI